MIQKLFRRMLTAQIVSAMTVTLCMLIDSAMIGRFLGVDAMAAYGYTAPVLLAFAAPGAMIAAGVQVVCGRTMGGGDREGTDACFTVSVRLTLGLAAVGLVLVLCFAGPLSTLLGAGKPGPNNPVFALTKQYLTGFILGVPAFLTAQIMVPYLQMAGKRKRLVAAVALMTVSDVVFDLLNVLVFHGGTFGMGLASSLSYYLALLVGGGYFLNKDCLFHLQPWGLRLDTLRAVLSDGIPTVVNQLSLVLMVFLLNRILRSAGGHTAVAAYSVVSTVSNLCYAFSSGIGSVALMLAAVFYADEDRSALLVLVKTIFRYAAVLLTGVTIVILLSARPLVGLFLPEEPETMALAVQGLRLFSLCLVPCALNTGLKFYFQGTGRVRLMELISVLQNFLLPALAALVLCRFCGTAGVWLTFVCGECAAFLLICLRVRKGRRLYTLRPMDFALLAPDFGAAPEDCFERAVLSAEDATRTSEEAASFCRSHGQGERMSFLVGLCIEEIACNIVRYGFNADKDRHSINVRLVFRNGEGLIRIRDNCTHFDPLRYLELNENDDRTSHMGIRLVMSSAKEVAYLNSLGLNNLTLRL